MLGIKVHPLNFLLTRESIPLGLRQLGYHIKNSTTLIKKNSKASKQWFIGFRNIRYHMVPRLMAASQIYMVLTNIEYIKSSATSSWNLYVMFFGKCLKLQPHWILTNSVQSMLLNSITRYHRKLDITPCNFQQGI